MAALRASPSGPPYSRPCRVQPRDATCSERPGPGGWWRSWGAGLNPSHNGLPSVVNIDALDPNDLVWTTAKMPQDFDLLGVCPHQPRGRGCRRDYAAIRTMAAPKASQPRHGRRMATGHLHGQCRLNLVFRSHRLDVGEGRIYSDLGNAAARQSSGGLQLE